MNDKLNNLIAMEEWKGMPPEEREWLTFRFLQKIDTRLISLEKRKRIDTGVSAVTGVVGGAIAYLVSRVKFGG